MNAEELKIEHFEARVKELLIESGGAPIQLETDIDGRTFRFAFLVSAQIFQAMAEKLTDLGQGEWLKEIRAIGEYVQIGKDFPMNIPEESRKRIASKIMAKFPDVSEEKAKEMTETTLANMLNDMVTTALQEAKAAGIDMEKLKEYIKGDEFRRVFNDRVVELLDKEDKEGEPLH